MSLDVLPAAYRAHLEAVTGEDPGSVRAAWEPDGVLAFPYGAALGAPARVEGIDAIVGYFTALDLFVPGSWTFSNVHAWTLDGDPGHALVEAHGSATLTATRGRYEQDYVSRLRLGPSRRLALLVERFDPTRT